MPTRRSLLNLALLTVPLVALAVGFQAAPTQPPQAVQPKPQVESSLNALTDPNNLRRTVTVAVAAKAKDAVVYISTERIVAQSQSPFPNDPLLRNFGARTVLVPSNSLGSGFIVHEAGYIVTNNHVIDRARKIRVQLSDDRQFDAEVVSTDPDADLAILKIASDKPLPTLPLGDSSDLMIGEPVIAVGNPLGYSYSVSTGIVSAIHRDIQPDPTKSGLSDLIQTDAAVNPGNSGGPLLNAYGQVIGINTAIRSDAQNIGFAIQINTLRDLIPQLLDPAKVNKTTLPLELAERRTLTPPATVTPEVILNSSNGPRKVLSINGRPPRDIIDAYVSLLSAQPKSEVAVAVEGNDIVKATSTPIPPPPMPEAIAQARRLLGLTVEPVTPDLAERTGLRIADGMLITEVVRRSVAEKAQLQPGDVIFQLGRFRVRSLSDFSQLMSQLPPKGAVRIGILRGDSVGYGVLQL